MYFQVKSTKGVTNKFIPGKNKVLVTGKITAINGPCMKNRWILKMCQL